MFKFDLGIEAKDKVTGFKGIIVGRADYLTGCSQYALQPKIEKDTWKENKWFDENRLDIVGKKKINLTSNKDNGCDITPPLK